jgi:ParB/RepB/Spo0J family partition protein
MAKKFGRRPSAGEESAKRDALVALRKVVANDAQIIEINPALIAPARFQPRRRLKSQSIETLVEGFKAVGGQMQAIAVRPLPEGAPRLPEAAPEGTAPYQYELIFGQRRTKAASALAWPVKAVVCDVGDTTAMLMATIENSQREDPTDLDIALTIAALQETGKTAEAICLELGIGARGDLYRYLSYFSLPEDVMEYIDTLEYEDLAKFSRTYANAMVVALRENPSASAIALELAQAVVARAITVADMDHKLRQHGKGAKQPAQPAAGEAFRDAKGKTVAQWAAKGNKISVTFKDKQMVDELTEVIKTFLRKKGLQ